MSDRLKGLFGDGDDDDETKETAKRIGVDPGQAKGFVNRVLDGDPSEGFDDDEAVSNFEKVSRNASPEQMERATRQALGNMTPNQRGDFAKMLQQRQAGEGMVPIQRAGERGTGGGGGDMGIDDILGGLMGGGGGGGGLGGMLGGLLGGGGGGSSQGGGGGGLGGMLGGLLGGGDNDDNRSRSQSGAQTGGQGGGMMGGLGDLLGSPAGKALVGGIAAFGMKELLEKKR